MNKKIALVLTSLLILTVLLTTPSFKPSATSALPPEGPYHWKIEVAQKKADSHIFGELLDPTGLPIPDTEFELWCGSEEEMPHPSQRVYWKVKTDIIPGSIHFIKEVDWNRDGWPDEIVEVIGDLVDPDPLSPSLPKKW